MPKLSIIVPIYKVESYLEECVQSILKQTFTDFELILVDDGSPDNSPLMCDTWANKDSRVKVIHKINGGVQSAIIAGTKAAIGKYIGYVDGDDWVAADYFEMLVSAMERHDADMVVVGWTVHNGAESLYQKDNLGQLIMDAPEIEKNILQPFWTGGGELLCLNNRWNKLWCAEKVKQIMDDLHRELCIGEDMEQVLRYLPLCQKIVFFGNYTGYYYRYNDSSATRVFSEKIVMQYSILKKVLQEIASNQKRAYSGQRQREGKCNLDCLWQLYSSKQTINGYIQYAKEILQADDTLFLENLDILFKMGFAILQKRMYLLGTICIKTVFGIEKWISGVKRSVSLKER